MEPAEGINYQYRYQFKCERYPTPRSILCHRLQWNTVEEPLVKRRADNELRLEPWVDSRRWAQSLPCWSPRCCFPGFRRWCDSHCSCWCRGFLEPNEETPAYLQRREEYEQMEENILLRFLSKSLRCLQIQHKAFDMVVHNILQGELGNWFEFYLKEREYFVSNSNYTSKSRKIIWRSPRLHPRASFVQHRHAPTSSTYRKQ